MYNWSVDESELKKHPQKYKIWKLEQLIDFGLGEEKLVLEDVKKHLGKLNIDTDKKSFLKFLISR